MLFGLSLRDRIFVLLVGVLLLGAAASAVSIWALDGVARRGRDAARFEVEVSETLSQVAAGHLEQTAALERGLLEPWPGEGDSPAQQRFEERAAEMWRGLKAVREQLASAPGGTNSPVLLKPIAALDLAHNDYAARGREAFSALEEGRLGEARQRATEAEVESIRFQASLGALLALASERAEAELDRLQQEQRRAMLLVAVLSSCALLVGAAAVLRALQLVSRIRSLTGMLPICASCKSIRDDSGYWNRLEEFVEANSEVQFTHGLCGPCVAELKSATAAAAA
jgi:hypothetical protein